MSCSTCCGILGIHRFCCCRFHTRITIKRGRAWRDLLPSKSFFLTEFFFCRCTPTLLASAPASSVGEQQQWLSCMGNAVAAPPRINVFSQWNSCIIHRWHHYMCVICGGGYMPLIHRWHQPPRKREACGIVVRGAGQDHLSCSDAYEAL